MFSSYISKVLSPGLFQSFPEMDQSLSLLTLPLSTIWPLVAMLFISAHSEAAKQYDK